MTKNNMTKRTCRNCSKEKEIELFEVDNRIKNGRTYRCKECKAAVTTKAQRAYYRLKKDVQEGEELITVNQLDTLLDFFGGSCAYCGQGNLCDKQIHFDHVIPKSINGNHSAANILVACSTCNAKKGNKSLIKFFLENNEDIPVKNMQMVVNYLALMHHMTPQDYLKQLGKEHLRVEEKRFERKRVQILSHEQDYLFPDKK